MNIKSLAIAAAITLTGFAANAATMKAVYSGTITSSYVEGQDFFGVGAFGTGVMNGLAFTATYIFDTDIGYAQGTATSPQLYGYGATSPVLSAVLTINGVDVGSNDPNYGTVYRQAGYSGSTTQVGAQFQQSSYNYLLGATEFSVYNSGLVGNGDLTLDLDGLIDADITDNGAGFLMQSYVPATYVRAYYLSATFDATHLSVSAVPAVPLPASLPLLAVALGGFGIMSRRRTKAKRA